MSDLDGFYDDAVSPGPVLGPIFTAAYGSECESCDDPIVPGEDARSDGRGGWIHADDQCEKVAVGPSDWKTRNPSCPSCFTVHAGECL